MALVEGLVAFEEMEKISKSKWNEFFVFLRRMLGERGSLYTYYSLFIINSIFKTVYFFIHSLGRQLAKDNFIHFEFFYYVHDWYRSIWHFKNYHSLLEGDNNLLRRTHRIHPKLEIFFSIIKDFLEVQLYMGIPFFYIK